MYMKCKNFCIRVLVYTTIFLIFGLYCSYVWLNTIDYMAFVIALIGSLMACISTLYLKIYSKLSSKLKRTSFLIGIPLLYTLFCFFSFKVDVSCGNDFLDIFIVFLIACLILYFISFLALGYILFIIELAITIIKKHKKF